MSFFLEDNKARFVKSLITLTEAVAEISQPLDKILRLASYGEIDLYCQSRGEKIEYGTLGLIFGQGSPIEWPANQQNNYAQVLHPLIEDPLLKKPDYFVPDGYDFLDNEIILLQPRHIPALLANREIVIKYGWLSRGDAFKIIKPAEGMQIGRDGLLISTKSDWFKELKQQQQKSDLDQAQQQKEEESFVIPPGTEWYDIKIHFVDLDTIEITIGKQRTIQRSYRYLEWFYNSKSKKPKVGWHFLFVMVKYQGNIPLPPRCKGDNKEVAVKRKKDKVSQLRSTLRKMFPGVSEDPFEPHKTTQGWKPKLTLSLSKKLQDDYPQW